MESQLAGTPHHLSHEVTKKENKGHYHWMRPYARFEPQPRKVPNVLISRLPKAFVLRYLLDFISLIF